MSSVRPTPDLFTPPNALSVTQLTMLIRAAIQRHVPQSVVVVGELSNISRPSSGHLYFTLKDPGSEVRCAMWRSSAVGLKFNPVDGMEVIVTGHVDMYEQRGQIQLYVTRLEPRGVGALQLAFRQLKEKLEKLGLFDHRRKRPLPPFPSRIALVTSLTGAAIRDIVQTIRRRYACVRLFVHPVRVQGDGAAEEIAAAIRAINRHAARLGGVDVMIVGRGGGSLEGLWAFNTEIVARAIFDSRISIVSAVGHEVDISIADLVADVRAATPTAAAELVVPMRAQVLADFDGRASQLRRAVLSRIDGLTARLARVASNELFRDPRGYIARRGQHLDECAACLRAAATHRFSAARARLHNAEVRLHAVRPEVVLMRRAQRVNTLEHRLFWAQGHANVVKERRLAVVWGRLLRASPAGVVSRNKVLIEQFRARLLHAVSQDHVRRNAGVEALASRLAASSHERVLARGFTITRQKRNGRIVTDPKTLREGERLVTQTAAGGIESRVVDSKQGDLFDSLDGR